MELQPRMYGIRSPLVLFPEVWTFGVYYGLFSMGKHVQNKYPSKNGRDNRTYQLKAEWGYYEIHNIHLATT